MTRPVACRQAFLAAALLLAWAGSAGAQAREAAASPPRAALGPRESDMLGTQVALDRAGFSPGEIDAARGPNTSRALQAFARARGVPADAHAAATRQQLGPRVERPLVEYVLTREDVAGPYVGVIPDDLMEQSQLPSLGYATPLERLAEKFHVSPRLVTRINGGIRWTAGTAVLVPDVEPFSPPARSGKRTASPASPTAVTITVSSRDRTLEVQDEAGQVVFFAPVTVGGVNDPLPVGEWKVTGVFDTPPFHYNPALFWDADPSHAKARIAPGPNNPVGVVWIDLDKEHYGFHGTPEPGRVGHTQSHGCIRLTNWDAMRVAALVSDGVRVVLR